MTAHADCPRNLLAEYRQGDFYCELLGADDEHAAEAAPVRDRLSRFELADLERRARDAERELYSLGITFLILSDQDALDRILPFDVIPRVVTGSEWRHLEAGIVQRVTALNLFLKDIYHEGRILKDGVVPAELILKHPHRAAAMDGFDVPRDTYVHIVGIDLVRDTSGRFLVLEDNGRCPSGVSYVIENRKLMQRTFPDLMANIGVRSVDDYGPRLFDALCEVAPPGLSEPRIVLLSPGTYNSAYFEHVFLAREMGVPLVEGRDLVVENDFVYMKTIDGRARVDTIYRRIGDDFLDPLCFRPDSLLGVPGLMQAYRRGRVTLANAVGTGVADDKAVYAYLPRIVQYYLGEDPLLDNVPTHICREEEGLAYTLAHLDQLVVKPVGEAGGYGITIGPHASRGELDRCRQRLLANPSDYISQPMVPLSVCPTLTADGIEPRHVDLRPFAVTGETTWVLPGGLTRVALRKGTLIVNSSQGGGSKDTWVLGGPR